MSFSIVGKTAIVTGAANGVGLAIAQHFVAEGANVMFVDMDEVQLKRNVEALEPIENTAGEGRAQFFAGDVRKRLTVANLLSATIDAFDRVDILVNAARQFARTDLFNAEDTSVEDLLDQNLMSSFRLSQAVARRMIKQGGETSEEGAPQKRLGTIVNLSSIAAEHTRPDLLGYSISSAALNQMTRAMAVAFAPHGIRVNAVAFGSVLSASLQRHLEQDDGLEQATVSGTPIGRLAAPSEVSDAVQYLASDGSGFVTGHVMVVDGGRSLLDPVVNAAH